EPTVGKLVQDRIRAGLIHVVAGLRREYILIADGDTACVFHGAGVELRNENLVILAKGVRETEICVVEIKTLLGFGEQTLRIQMLCQRSAAVQPQRDFELRGWLAFGVRGELTSPGVSDLKVRPRAYGNEVGR